MLSHWMEKECKSPWSFTKDTPHFYKFIDLLLLLYIKATQAISYVTLICYTFPEIIKLLLYGYLDLLPHPSSISCSLFSSENPGVTFQWNSSFNSQHAVERYHVAVTPDITDCSRYVNSSENYNCSRLTLGTNYTFSVSVVNSENDKGMKYSITIQPQGS